MHLFYSTLNQQDGSDTPTQSENSQQITIQTTGKSTKDRKKAKVAVFDVEKVKVTPVKYTEISIPKTEKEEPTETVTPLT